MSPGMRICEFDCVRPWLYSLHWLFPAVHLPAPNCSNNLLTDVKLLDWHVKEITVTERVKHYAFEDRSYSQVCTSSSLSLYNAFHIHLLLSFSLSG